MHSVTIRARALEAYCCSGLRCWLSCAFHCRVGAEELRTHPSTKLQGFLLLTFLQLVEWNLNSREKNRQKQKNPYKAFSKKGTSLASLAHHSGVTKDPFP